MCEQALIGRGETYDQGCAWCGGDNEDHHQLKTADGLMRLVDSTSCDLVNWQIDMLDTVRECTYMISSTCLITVIDCKRDTAVRR